MDAIDPPRLQITFNGPLEAGIRAVALLGAAYPKAFDLQRLTALDYLLVRTKTSTGAQTACTRRHRCARPMPRSGAGSYIRAWC